MSTQDTLVFDFGLNFKSAAERVKGAGRSRPAGA